MGRSSKPRRRGPARPGGKIRNIHDKSQGRPISEHERRLARLNNIVIVSDTHFGCKLALCSGPVVLDERGEYHPSSFQKSLRSMWEYFWEEWVPDATRGEDFAVLHNGDVIDGVHHGATTLITNNLNDQRQIAYDILRPVVDRCDGLYFQIRGTEAHVGKSAQEEEALARMLDAIPDENGLRARYDLWINVGGYLVHALHHIGTSGSSAYEATAIHKEVMESLTEAARWNYRPPDVVVRCLSRACRILTPSGWRGVDDIRKGDEVISFDLESRQLCRDRVFDVVCNEEPEPVWRLAPRPLSRMATAIPVLSRSGKCRWVSSPEKAESWIESEGLGIRLTPDHRLVVRHAGVSSTAPFRLVEASAAQTGLDGLPYSHMVSVSASTLSAPRDNGCFGPSDLFLLGAMLGCCFSWQTSSVWHEGRLCGIRCRPERAKTLDKLIDALGEYSFRNCIDWLDRDVSMAWSVPEDRSRPSVIYDSDSLVFVHQSLQLLGCATSDIFLNDPALSLASFNWSSLAIGDIYWRLLTDAFLLKPAEANWVSHSLLSGLHAAMNGELPGNPGAEIRLEPVPAKLAEQIQALGAYSQAWSWSTDLGDGSKAVVWKPKPSYLLLGHDVVLEDTGTSEPTWCVKTSRGTLVAMQDGVVLVLGNSHRHRHIETTVPTFRGRAIGVVTPAWQGKTPYVWKLAGMRLSPPQFGGILVRSSHGRIFVDSCVWTPRRSLPVGGERGNDHHGQIEVFKTAQK